MSQRGGPNFNNYYDENGSNWNERGQSSRETPSSSSRENGNGQEWRSQFPRPDMSVREIFLKQVRGEIPAPIIPPLLNSSKTQTYYSTKIKRNDKGEPESRRDMLIEQFTKCNYECMVCCSKIYPRQSIWNCVNCFNAFHLHCIKKWSVTSAVESEWRCPACQNILKSSPTFYYCFCGKVKNPPFCSSDIPHSCGASCGKKKNGGLDCSHVCGLRCHPGPCEDCTDMVARPCACGKSHAVVQCQTKSAVLCGSTCGKPLNCKIHKCTQKCHPNPCENCSINIVLDCFCGRNKKTAFCSTEANASNRPKYSCELECGKKLNCNNHVCSRPCHPDHCLPCPTSIDVIVSCPCGQTSIAQAASINNLPIRKTCKDPIPLCGKTCNKVLKCGGSESVHKCVSTCHDEGSSPCFCPLTSTFPCRCARQNIEISCSEYEPGSDILCQKRCSRKRSCGKHKCNTKCCIDTDHICMIVCDRPLSCGNHRCTSLCHNGFCKMCPDVSFDELRCECGASVLYPPVPCGTLPPSCNQICSRPHECEHPVLHQCHSDPKCPPCSFLTEKWCYGNHLLRKNIPCFNQNVSCGLPCGKILKCTRHTCPKICHSGICEEEEDVCQLQCGNKVKCGHPCSAKCHEEACPDVLCKKIVEVICSCGRRKEGILCWKRDIEYEKLIDEGVREELSKIAASKSCPKEEEDNLAGPTKVEKTTEEITEEITKKLRASMSISIVLKCDKECAKTIRLGKMAQALQLHNPDPETRLSPPNYSEFLKKFTQKSPKFVEMVHEKLTNLVMQTKKVSAKKNTTYGFDSMNREKRTVIHEYSDHFGIQSESFDEEPNRNVIVTASRDKCWLPSVSLMDVVFPKSVSVPYKTDLERKNVYQDLELSQAPKTKIYGPVNKFKI